MKSNLFKTILNAVAVAMGVAVIVTNVVAPMSVTSLTSLLGLGVAALGIAGLQKTTESSWNPNLVSSQCCPRSFNGWAHRWDLV